MKLYPYPSILFSALSILSLILPTPPALAAPGAIDTGFNGGVPAITGNSSGDVQALGAAINPVNGDIVRMGDFDETGGSSVGEITAYKPDGSLDMAVGSSGIITLTPSETGLLGDSLDLTSVAVDGQGRILATGFVINSSGTSAAMVLVRFKSDGTLDSTFGSAGNGVVSSSLNGAALGTSLSLTADGHILVSGNAYDASDIEFQLTVWRFDSDGTPDAGFGNGGYTQIPSIARDTTQFCFNALQPKGSLITGCRGTGSGAAGSWKITRLNPDGSVDTGFGASGYVSGSAHMSLSGLASTPEGGFVISELDTSTSPETIDLRRYRTDGSVDTTFNGGGPLPAGTTTSELVPLVMQPDGKIIVSQNDDVGTGAPNLLQIVRLLVDGTPDPDFGNSGDNGLSILNFNGIDGVDYMPFPTAMVLQSNGKIDVVGQANSSAGSNRVAFVTRVLNDAFTFTPDTVSFMNQTDVDTGATITSNAVTIAGLSDGVTVPVSVTGGEYRINDGAWTSIPGRTQNGDQIAVRQTSSNSSSTSTTTTLNVGGEAIPNNNATVLGTPLSVDFTSTTKATSTGGGSSGGGSGGGGGGFGGPGLLLLMTCALIVTRKRRRQAL